MKRTERKRRSIWIDIAFSIAIIALTAGVIFMLTNMKDGKNHASEVKSLKDKIVVDSSDSNYPGIKIISETSNDKIVPYFIQYPKSTFDDFNEQVSEYIEKVRNEYIALMEQAKNKKDTKGELNVSFETFVHASGHYSFVLVMNMFIDEKKHTTEVRAFHLHTETGEQLQVESVFRSDEEVLQELAQKISNFIKEDEVYQNNLLEEQLDVTKFSQWENLSNFALTDDAVIFYFEENSILKKKVGVPIVTLPIELINHLLEPSFQLTNIEQNNETTNVGEEPSDTEEKEPTTPNDETPNTEDDTDQVPSDVKKVALTFDDGPDPKTTVQILETLKKYDAKATFFMLGSRVEYYPEIAKQVQEAGHQLGNHSWNHPDLTKLGAERVRDEINNTSAIIEQVTGAQATVFRPPYGAINSAVRTQTNLPVILWDVDTLDWKHRNAEKLLEKVKAGTSDGSIILMHDIHQSTADGLDAVLQYLQTEGYTFVTMDELGYE